MSAQQADFGSRRGFLGHCLNCWLTLAAALAVVWASFAYLALDLTQLFTLDSARAIAGYAARFFPPDLSPAFLHATLRGSLETLAMSAIGTLLAAGTGLVLALPASGRFGPAFKLATRFALNALRSVPELVWAALTVLAAGLGPFAGTLALALHTSGVLGRLFAESLENAPTEPALALTHSGARPALAFVYGTLPTIVPQLIAYSLYRWEMNVRMATILGFVGAGGLGQMLYYQLALLNEPRACTVVGAMLALVIAIDAASAWIRRRLVAAQG